MDWTAEAIETLRALWAEGHSTAEIGRRMGISKNAVVGKAHRLSLPARPSPIRREAGTQAGAGARPTAAPQPAVAEPAPVAAQPSPPAVVAGAVSSLPPATKPIMPAAALAAPRPALPPRRAAQPSAVVRPFQRLGGRTCCWPIGEPGTPEFRFCTAEAISGKPYCPEHASIAYVKARDRREDAA
ncbi:GcrA family cell cycle regulator [Teichococcus oryzae]|uniref:GcrA cell cycle regulator n=1 Tax=Teichococcus oryzae TaxID=1608942 RepID=A0A5B2TJD0_9PROT|nr:GcrA family cell cycle regulator [Pseudoroseomonas oryzae]KAA2214606.1 GcrA cell cycle regulator [Pseudoroseomonas oryzae]